MAQKTEERMAPDFTLCDTNGTKVSLSEFKGKVIYLDIWASWCRPCIAQAPFAEELHAAFKDNPNIAFVNISLDKDTLKWKQRIAEKHMTGIHLLSPEGIESDIQKNYNVTGIPRFIIIDKNGMIVEEVAKRPSEKGVAKALSKLIDK